MAIEVTRKWSTFEWGDDRATIEFQVSGVPDGPAGNAAARTAVPFQKGSTFESDSTLKMWQHPRVVRDFGLRDVICEFTRQDPTTGGGGGSPDDELTDEEKLALPPSVLWGSTSITEPTNQDLEGNPIRNTAGDFYSPMPTRTIYSDTVAITKYLQSFPYLTLQRFRGTVNNADVGLTNTNVVWKKGQIACLGITAPEYRIGGGVIPCTLTMEVRTNYGDHPFRLATVNRGRNGWYTEGGTTKSAEITSASGQPVNEDVPLNSGGIPCDTTLRVNNQTPVLNPNSVTGWITAPESKAPFVIQLWQMLPELDFTELFRDMNI